jgi:selenide,water dikinase
MHDWQCNLLCDPQTSAGLLIACAPDASPAVLEMLWRQNWDHATIIGRFTAGVPRDCTAPKPQ